VATPILQAILHLTLALVAILRLIMATLSCHQATPATTRPLLLTPPIHLPTTIPPMALLLEGQAMGCIPHSLRAMGMAQLPLAPALLTADWRDSSQVDKVLTMSCLLALRRTTR
jgi:hypothetical protein